MPATPLNWPQEFEAVLRRVPAGLDILAGFSDSSTVTPEQARIFKAMSPAQKLSLAARFYFDSRHLKAQGLRAQHPDWPEEKILRRVKELFLYAAS